MSIDFNQKWFFVGVNRERNEATIFNVTRADITASLYENMRVDADLETITKVDLDRLFQKFSISNIKDVTDEELMSLFNEIGCFKE